MGAKRITLTLDRTTALVLLDVLRSVAGNPSSARGRLDAIHNVLRDCVAVEEIARNAVSLRYVKRGGIDLLSVDSVPEPIFAEAEEVVA